MQFFISNLKYKNVNAVAFKNKNSNNSIALCKKFKLKFKIMARILDF